MSTAGNTLITPDWIAFEAVRAITRRLARPRLVRRVASPAKTWCTERVEWLTADVSVAVEALAERVARRGWTEFLPPELPSVGPASVVRSNAYGVAVKYQEGPGLFVEGHAPKTLEVIGRKGRRQ